MKKALTLALSIALLSGCSAIQQSQLYYTDSAPTAASVKAAGGAQVYNDSLFTSADFNADGTARTFEQYNFAAESAPCAILGKGLATGYNSARAGTVYAVQQGEKKLTFNCRATNRSVMAPELRLFQVGSDADCASRSGSVPTITMAGVRQNLQCNGYRINRGKATPVDLAFKG